MSEDTDAGEQEPQEIAGRPAPQPSPSNVRLVPPSRKTPFPRELDDYEAMRARIGSRLADVRKAAEAWRTGLGGLVAIVTAFLFFKGEESIRSYEDWAQGVITVAVVVGLLIAVWSLWRFMDAANSRLTPISTEDIRAAGGLLPYDLKLADQAVDDLMTARTTALWSAGILATVIVFSWFAPLS